MSMIIDSYRFGVGPPASLYDLIIADSPAYYFRHAEPSGSVMENEVGTDGAYVLSGVTLGATALYPGGPTSVRLPAAGFSGAGRKTGGTSPSLAEITVMGIVKFDSALSGTKGLICYDNGSSLRKWQLRTNGTGLEWVKIEGGVVVKSHAAGFVNGNTYFIATTIDAAGNFKFNINGVNVHTSTIATADYGSAAEYIEIGRCDGGGGITANAFFSESTIFDYAVSDSRLADYATAAGF